MSGRRAFPVLEEGDLSPDPFEQFARWYELAAAEVPLADAMTLATLGADGAPDARAHTSARTARTGRGRDRSRAMVGTRVDRPWSDLGVDGIWTRTDRGT